MEIEFKNVVYAQNNSLNNGKLYLNDFNYIFSSDNLYALIGDASEVIGKLLTLEKRPTKGSITINGNIINKTAKVDNFNDIKKELVYLDFNDKYQFSKTNFIDELTLLFDINKKDIKTNIMNMAENSLKMVGLKLDVIKDNLWDLSTGEKIKAKLALNLCLNPKVIVLKDIDKYLIHKEKNNLKMLLLKLKNRYHKLIVIISDNAEFLLNLVNKLVVIHNSKEIPSYNEDVFYNEELYKYIKKPYIIDFINYVNKRKHHILNYTDNKELIKAIYRDVTSKK